MAKKKKVVKKAAKKAVRKSASKKRAAKKRCASPKKNVTAAVAGQDSISISNIDKPDGQGITSAKVILTGVDRLMALVKANHRISLKQATKELGIGKDVVEEWAEFLESEGLLYIQRGFIATYLIDKYVTKEQKEVIKGDVDRQKDIITRKIEGAILGLQRDADEIRFVKNEFEELHDFVKDNFDRLEEQFRALSEFHDAYQIIKGKKKGIESGYATRLSEIDTQLDNDRKKYDATLRRLNERLASVEEQRRKMHELDMSRTDVEGKIKELTSLLAAIKSELDDESKVLDLNKKGISDEKKKLLEIKSDIKREGDTLTKIFSEMGKVRVELMDAEKSFMEKVAKISEAKIPKKEVISRGYNIVAKIKDFLAESADIKDTLKRLDRDKLELEKAYKELIKKTAALAAAAKKGETPCFQWEALDKERETTDRLRSQLTKDLGVLRDKVRKITK